MEKSDILQRFMSELDRSSPQTQTLRRYWAEKFLKFAPSDFAAWNKTLVNAYEKKLRIEGYAPTTMRGMLGVVKRVFEAGTAVHEKNKQRIIQAVDPSDPTAVAEMIQAMQANGPDWDLGKRFLPKIQNSDMKRPAITDDEMGLMVEAAKSGKLSLGETCYLALGSIYGLRRGEICAVRQEDFDFDYPCFFVHTEKGGEQRKQLLAEPILPYLKKFDWPAITPIRMSYTFKDVICYKSGVLTRHKGTVARASAPDGDAEWLGFHAVRRYLDTIVRDALASDAKLNRDAQLITHIFFRWHLATGEMSNRYYTVDPLAHADPLVLEHHPVVKLWE